VVLGFGLWYCSTIRGFDDSVCNTVERQSLSYMVPPFSIPVFTEETWNIYVVGGDLQSVAVDKEKKSKKKISD